MIPVKFGQRQHLEEFRNDGLLHMNSQTYFSRLEADSVRADRFEGSDRIIQPSALQRMTIENADGTKIVILPQHLAGPLLIGLGKKPPCNIFCMFAVTKLTIGPFVDERNFAFGDSFVIVLNTQEFIDRVCSAAAMARLDCDYGLVEYYDVEAYTGEIGPFSKPSAFAYQNEFRFVIHPGSRQPMRLNVGSLLDITTPIHSLSEINRLVDFGVEGTQQAELS
jgi:hypothetical protein